MIKQLDIKNDKNNIDTMLNQIVQEKNKLEKLTKTVLHNKPNTHNNHTKKNLNKTINKTTNTNNLSITDTDINNDDDIDIKVFDNLGLKNI